MAVLVFAMAMEGVHLTRMDGTVYVKMVGVEQDAISLWKWRVLIIWITIPVLAYFSV